ncbi:MAG: choice-of-anchor D domain-containing protein, partial [Geobacteraceae bacterium]|nr:choice-of-anchor D domain-containing protein [Geobacteraceae bacterium]
VSSVRGQLSFSQMNPMRLRLDNCGGVQFIDYDNIANILKLYRLGGSSACISRPGVNDTLAQASSTSFGNVLTGLIDATSNPVDWYKLDAVAGDSIQITVNYDNRAPNSLTIGLYDGQENLLSGSTSTNPLGIKTTAGSTGTHYLKVEATGGRFGYTVSIDKSRLPFPEVIYTSLPNVWDLMGNDLGEVVWIQNDETGNQVYSNIHGQITTNATRHYSPVVNNLGDVFWSEDTSMGWVQINGIISGQPVLLASGQFIDMWTLSANDRGEVVWTQRDNSNYYQVYSSVRGQLTSTMNELREPAINNLGDVVWTQRDNTGFRQIYKLVAGSTTPVAVTSDLTDHFSPAINDAGEVIWTQDISGMRRIVSSVRGQLSFSQMNPMRLRLNNCGDVQFTDWDSIANVQKLYRLGGSSACLSVGKNPQSSGMGQILSTPAGLSLGATTSFSMAGFPFGSQVTLSASTYAGSIFTGWSGACSGTGNCQVTMNQAKSVTASFTAAPVAQAAPAALSFGSITLGNSSVPQAVTLSNSGAAAMVVSGIILTGTDSDQFAVVPGTCTSLTPAIGAGGSCTVSVTFAPTRTGARNASLQIASNDPVNPSLAVSLSGTGASRQYLLAVDHAGSGSGLVNSSPGVNMACATGSCSRSYDQGTELTLTASPDSNSVFTGWSGACSGTGSCSVTMNGDSNVTATFEQASAKVGSISYSSVAATYAGATGGETFKLYGTALLEALDLNRPITVTLQGGYNTGFSGRSGFTTIQKLTVTSGTVIIDGIIIR